MMTYPAERAYREIRALNEDLLEAPSSRRRRQLRTALREALRMHCRECGDVLDREQRTGGEEFCYACVPPSPRELSHGT